MLSVFLFLCCLSVVRVCSAFGRRWQRILDPTRFRYPALPEREGAGLAQRRPLPAAIGNQPVGSRGVSCCFSNNNNNNNNDNNSILAHAWSARVMARRACIGLKVFDCIGSVGAHSSIHSPTSACALRVDTCEVWRRAAATAECSRPHGAGSSTLAKSRVNEPATY